MTERGQPWSCSQGALQQASVVALSKHATGYDQMLHAC
jgi:hypothetical protein